MAKTTIAGNSFVITSAVKMADLETAKKYRPESLSLKNPETKETMFKVGIGANNINEYGISFGGTSNDDDKLATATLCIPDGVENAKEYVLDKAGTVIANLEKVEAAIVEALEEIRTERAAIAENINIVV